MKRRHYLSIGLLAMTLLLATHLFAAEPLPKPDFTIPLGEKIKFSIRWLGFEVGRAEVHIKEIVKIRNQDTYHIQVNVQSNRLIDLIWPVRDEHHTFIDVKKLHPLRYEKKVSEGHYRADEVVDFDQENHKARYESRRSGDVKEMLIPKNVQDQLSCMYWFRIQDLKPGGQISFPVNTDEKNWDLDVNVGNIEELKIPGFGKVKAVQTEPLARFQGMFVRKGRIFGWMSADARRIPLMMQARVPKLGNIKMVIIEYDWNNLHMKA